MSTINNWIDVNDPDNKPTSGEYYYVFIHYKERKIKFQTIMMFHSHIDERGKEISAWLFACGNNYCYTNVTHYMPLHPEPITNNKK